MVERQVDVAAVEQQRAERRQRLGLAEPIDSALDVVTANNTGNDFSLLLGKGDATLQTSANYGLTPDKLALAKPDAIVLHPGPINRGVEIASDIADAELHGPERADPCLFHGFLIISRRPRPPA